MHIYIDIDMYTRIMYVYIYIFILEDNMEANAFIFHPFWADMIS